MRNVSCNLMLSSLGGILLVFLAFDAPAQVGRAGSYQNLPATIQDNAGYAGGFGNMPEGYIGAGHGAAGEAFVRTEQCATYCGMLASGQALTDCTNQCHKFCGDKPSVAPEYVGQRGMLLLPEHRRDLAVCVAIYAGAFGLQKTGTPDIDYKSTHLGQARQDFGNTVDWRAYAFRYTPKNAMYWDPCYIIPGGVANMPGTSGNPGQTVQNGPYHIHHSATCNKRFKSAFNFNPDLSQYDLGPICSDPQTIYNCEDWCRCGGCEMDFACVGACKNHGCDNNAGGFGQGFAYCAWGALRVASMQQCLPADLE